MFKMYAVEVLLKEAKDALDMQKEVREDIRVLMNYLLSEKQDIESYKKLQNIDKKMEKTL